METCHFHQPMCTSALIGHSFCFSGLGYIVGSETARFAGSWHWALRVTPIMGAAAVFLIIFVVKEPERGESEGKSHLAATSWMEDICKLIKK